MMIAMLIVLLLDIYLNLIKLLLGFNDYEKM